MVSRMLDPTPEIAGYESLMWVLGTLKGYSDWSAALDMIAISEDSRYGAVLQNLGTGGALHIMASDDTTRLQSRDSDVSIPVLVSDTVTISTTLTNNGNTTLGDAAGDTLTVNATSTFQAPATFNGNVSTTANTTIGDAAGDTLTVNATATFVNNASFNGNVTLGNAAGDTITVTGTTTFGGNATFNGTFATTAATNLGNGDTDAITVIGQTTFRNSASSTTQLYVDASNNRTLVGTATALGGAPVSPMLQVSGRLYVAPDSASDEAIQIRRSQSATTGWWFGVTADSSSDLTFKDDGGTEVLRLGDGGTLLLSGTEANFDVTDMGFFGNTPISQPGVSGTLTGATLAQLTTVVGNLLTALDNLGLIADNTT